MARLVDLPPAGTKSREDGHHEDGRWHPIEGADWRKLREDWDKITGGAGAK